MPNTKFRPADRVINNPPYAFAAIGNEVRAIMVKGADVIRLDIGSPDMPPAPHIIETLVEQSQASNTHGYAGYAGIPTLRSAITDYYQRRFGVTLDPDKEVLPLIGSKEGLVNMHLAWLNPGDVALAPDPGYGAYNVGPQIVGSVVETLLLRPENNWLPDFSAISPEILEKAKMMWLNYPNNPTGAVADLAFFEEAVAFCRANDILLCHDNPYGEITFDGYQSVSPLQVSGAKEVVIEFNSFSKTYNMAGWRVGMAIGSATAVEALSKIKTQFDSGFALPIQRMAIAALTGDQGWLIERNQVYQRRRDLVIATLADLGIMVPVPLATLYVWFPVPAGYTDVDFHRKLLHEAHVSIAPGSIFGEGGRNWMRLSISTASTRLEEALARLREVMGETD